MESVLESHGPCQSLELSIVQIGLETTELRVRNERQSSGTVSEYRIDRDPALERAASDPSSLSLSLSLSTQLSREKCGAGANLERVAAFFQSTMREGKRFFDRRVSLSRVRETLYCEGKRNGLETIGAHLKFFK